MQETPDWYLVRRICWRRGRLPTQVFLGFPGDSDGKESACKVEDLGLIPGLGRPTGGGNGYQRQCSGLENLMDYNEWGRKESDTAEWLSLSEGWTQLLKGNDSGVRLWWLNQGACEHGNGMQGAMRLIKSSKVDVCRMCSPISWQHRGQSRNRNHAALSLYTVVSRADITSHTQYPFKSNILGKEEKIPIINDPLVTCGDELGVRTTIPGAFACPSLGCWMLERDWQRMRLGSRLSGL